MGRAPCCDKANVKKGPWSPEEDIKLKEFIGKYGTGGNWIALPQKAGLKRCGKSCRLRWLNYLRPNIKHGEFSDDEDRIICRLFATIGSRWSIIAAQLPGRTDNDIKNYWNTKLKKKLLGLAPSQRKPDPQQQHQHQQQQFFSSSLETAIVPTSTSNGSSYPPQKPLLTGLEGFSISPDVVNTCTTITSSLLQAGPMHHYQVKDSGSLLIFGGEPSCSSSDGSCNRISYGKEIDQYEYGGVIEQNMGLESLFNSTSGLIEENQKFLLGSGCGGSQEERGSGLMWGETSLDYGYEEIKHLISSSSNGFSNLLLDDPSSAIRVGSYTAQGRMMYYY